MPAKSVKTMTEDDFHLGGTTADPTVMSKPEPVEEEDITTLEAMVAQEDAEESEDATVTEEVTDEEAEFSETQQTHIQTLIDRTVAVERRRRDRDMKKMFGTTDMNQVAELYAAGKAISAASGRSPRDLMNYVQERTGGGQSTVGISGAGGQTSATGSSSSRIEEQINELRAMLVGQKETELRGSAEKAAKQEFGSLYTDYQMEIEDKADELGLSLLDAAAIVLRPHLKAVAEKRVQTRKQSIRERKVASSNEGGGAVSGTLNLEALLSPKQKLVAKKMGVSFKDYAQQLQEAGLVTKRS